MIVGGLFAYVWQFILENPSNIPGVILGTAVSFITMEVFIFINNKSDISSVRY